MRGAFKSTNFSFNRSVLASTDQKRGYFAEQSQKAIENTLLKIEPTKQFQRRPRSQLFALRSSCNNELYQPIDSFQSSQVGIFSKELVKYRQEKMFLSNVEKETGFMYKKGIKFSMSSRIQ
ncbi:hypothetical protein SS50377_23827 [Spironucleus salmonicida]|uniref:Uncharacterized protein n=1 Tax=Spironucleus salmonicida TaxID=348837 RepID=V6LS38_9EUKA|nr:hypothetical protein SS50377_23827 [Spironucleus salmonicida]|eukprot:EST46506.1 Hypothetical protein SS50377_13587 [Spironucleus salmonicida]